LINIRTFDRHQNATQTIFSTNIFNENIYFSKKRTKNAKKIFVLIFGAKQKNQKYCVKKLPKNFMLEN